MMHDKEGLTSEKPRNKLFQGLVSSFNLSELKTLCFKLEFHYEDLPGESTISDMARELIAYVDRRNRLGNMLDILREERPTVNWPTLAQLKTNKVSETLRPIFSTPDSDVVRNAVWNALYQSLWSKKTFLNPHKEQQPLIYKFSARLWADYFKKPIDSRPQNSAHIFQEIWNYFFSCEDDEFFRYVEFILNYWNELRHYKPELINQAVNQALVREGVNRRYRAQYHHRLFVEGAIIKIDEEQPPSYTPSVKPNEVSVLSDIPDNISRTIHEQAKKRFSDDFSTVRYWIDKEVQAWRNLQAYRAEDVPASILTLIFEKATKSFPDDFSTRLYQIDKEVQAWRSLQIYQAADVPGDVLARIIEKAEGRFPDDFSTRKYQIDKEVQAWRNLRHSMLYSAYNQGKES